MTPLDLRWLIDGKLAGTARPLDEADFATLSQQGIRVLLNLSRSPLPFDLLSSYGHQAAQLPLADFTSPTLAQMERAVSSISWLLEAHLAVVRRRSSVAGRP